MGKPKNTIEKILSEENYHIDPNTLCWIWIRRCNVGGYPMISFENQDVFVHRISLEKKMGRKIKPKHKSLHKCDTPCCINPDHLFEGTQIDNMVDMVKKNRSSKGINQFSCKLTEEKVREIKYGHKGLNHRELSEIYGVSAFTISTIRRGLKWRHI